MLESHRVVKELHDECGYAAVDADEEVDAGQNHIRCAGHAEQEGSGIHHRSDGPPARQKHNSHSQTHSNFWRKNNNNNHHTHSPVQHQQQYECRQIGWRDVRFLLETQEDDDDDDTWDDIITLKHTSKNTTESNFILKDT